MIVKLPNPPSGVRLGPPDPLPEPGAYPPTPVTIRDEWAFRVARLELKPNDILAVKFERSMSQAHMASMQQVLRSCLDKAGLTNQCLILDENATLSVVSPTAETSS